MFRAVCGGQPEPRNVAGTGREMRNRSRPRGKAHHRSDTPSFQKVMLPPKAAVAPSMRHQRPTHSPRQRSELAAFESSTSTQAAPKPGHLPNGARTEPHQIAHRQTSRISASSHGGYG